MLNGHGGGGLASVQMELLLLLQVCCRTLASYCMLNGHGGGGLAFVQMELLLTLASYCMLNGHGGGGLASVQMELLLLLQVRCDSVSTDFYAPGLKVRRGHLVIGSYVRPFVRLSVHNSVPLTNEVQYLKFW